MLVIENTASGACPVLSAQNHRRAVSDDDDHDDVMEQELYSSELHTVVAISSLSRVQ